jgi:hypothetical protein
MDVNFFITLGSYQNVLHDFLSEIYKFRDKLECLLEMAGNVSKGQTL